MSQHADIHQVEIVLSDELFQAVKDQADAAGTTPETYLAAMTESVITQIEGGECSLFQDPVFQIAFRTLTGKDLEKGLREKGYTVQDLESPE